MPTTTTPTPIKLALVLLACGKRHRAMADAAAARWMDLITPRPIELTILTDRHLSATCLDRLPNWPTAVNTLKLHAWDHVPSDIDAILYADLDLYPLAQIDAAAALRGVDFVCVRDRWHHDIVCHVADAASIPRHRYFNAGFWIARRITSHAFTAARSLSGHLAYYDQTALNVAIHHDRAIRLAWLPWTSNAMDCDGTAPGLTAVHNPWIAYPAWEHGRHPVPPPPAPELADLVASFNLSHPYCTAPEHLFQLGEVARTIRARDCLDVGTFQFHSAAVLAASGAAVTTLDPQHRTSSRVTTHGGLRVDAMAHTSADWLDRDRGQYFDLIYHDAEHGRHIVPELVAWWNRIRPGGVLAVHDAEQLGDWPPASLPFLAHTHRTGDTAGRQLLLCWKTDSYQS